MNTSRLENGGRKSLYKSKKSIGFQPITVSFSVIAEFETFFCVIFRLFRSPQICQPLYVTKSQKNLLTFFWQSWYNNSVRQKTFIKNEL